MNQRGFSLLEAVIVAAIVATVAAFFLNATVSSEPGATHAAAAQFDAALAYARAYASAHGGASLSFAREDTAVAMTVPGAPPFTIDAAIHEKTLGAPPFTIVLNAAGHATGPVCPQGGWNLTLGSGPGAFQRSLACSP